MTPYEFALQAGVPLTIEAGGTYFVVDNCTGAFKVEFLNAKGGRVGELLDAAMPTDWAIPEDGFSKVTLTSPTSQTVKFTTSRGRTGRNVFTGTVSGSLGTLVQHVVNGVNALVVKILEFFNDETTKAGQAFIFGHSSGPGGAGQNAGVQLKNPAGSAVFVYIDKVTFYDGLGASAFQLQRSDADMVTDAGAGINKDIGGAAAVAHVRGGTTGGMVGTKIAHYVSPINVLQQVVFDPPLRLGAGEAVVLQGANANETCGVTWEWREKST